MLPFVNLLRENIKISVVTFKKRNDVVNFEYRIVKVKIRIRVQFGRALNCVREIIGHSESRG